MSENHCKDCRNYVQHYTFELGKPYAVSCGHCTLLRPKRKKPNAKACENFAAGSRIEEFATKTYLRKSLLQYMLSLELFPEPGDKG